MERSEVYRLIDGERAYQQAQGKPDERPVTGWLESIKYYLDNARSADYVEDVTEELRKVAALAVAALEQYGCQPREGTEQPAPQVPMPEDVAKVIEAALLYYLSRWGTTRSTGQGFEFTPDENHQAAIDAALDWLQRQRPTQKEGTHE